MSVLPLAGGRLKLVQRAAAGGDSGHEGNDLLLTALVEAIGRFSRR